MVKLPRPFVILEQQRSYCKQQTCIFPSDIIARAIEQCTALFFCLIRPHLGLVHRRKKNTKGAGADSGAVSPNADSIFKALCSS